MQNNNIKKFIENLGGRRAYQEKRAAKLGSPSLHDYWEDTFAEKAQALAEEERKLFTLKSLRALAKAPKQNINKACCCHQILNLRNFIKSNQFFKTWLKAHSTSHKNNSDTI